MEFYGIYCVISSIWTKNMMRNHGGSAQIYVSPNNTYVKLLMIMVPKNVTLWKIPLNIHTLLLYTAYTLIKYKIFSKIWNSILKTFTCDVSYYIKRGLLKLKFYFQVATKMAKICCSHSNEIKRLSKCQHDILVQVKYTN